MKKSIINDFPEVVSQPNWFWTWIIRGIFGFIFILILLFLYAEPIILYLEDYIYGDGAIIFFIIYYPLISLLLRSFILYLKKIRNHAIIQVMVDKKGIHYLRKNGSMESILYKELGRSDAPVVFDIFTQKNNRYGPTELKVNLSKKLRTVSFSATDVAYAYYTGNARELRSAFIQGITLFRPDLRISPLVYSYFFINPETFRFEKKEFWKTIIIVFIFFLLILTSIEWYMRYRFGFSLFCK